MSAPARGQLPDLRESYSISGIKFVCCYNLIG